MVVGICLAGLGKPGISFLKQHLPFAPAGARIITRRTLGPPFSDYARILFRSHTVPLSVGRPFGMAGIFSSSSYRISYTRPTVRHPIDRRYSNTHSLASQ